MVAVLTQRFTLDRGAKDVKKNLHKVKKNLDNHIFNMYIGGRKEVIEG